jgi:FtsZ-binding cell division protein ZapB
MLEIEELLSMEIEEIMKEIEELIIKMISLKEGKAKSDPGVITVNRELKEFADNFQEMIKQLL